ncbi:MAG: sodium-dependent transporter, partial [Treponema sp.]|nr:sodium-dependent transporter [Treponema sp.]
MNSTEKKLSRGTFSGHLGYVLAAAGSAVGLGNIWRFPYLAARYGGGIFLLVYVLLAVTFGYAMIISETSIGRMTSKSPVGAFSQFGKSGLLKTGGWINAIIPMLIVPYYSVIGGWVCKYLFEYIKGSTQAMAQDGFFGSFIGNPFSTELFFVIFALAMSAVILAGVNNGIEKVSKVMMPLLAVLALVVACFSVTRNGALAGVKYFFIPNFSNFSWMTVVAALGQMFYSLSIAMGILITYGSYMKKSVDIEKTTVQVIGFDSLVAVLAGLMIIPAVFAFSGGDPKALNAGPSLMFVTIPKVFAQMHAGRLVGILFFVLVLFAALTSAISLMECAVSTLCDVLKWKRGFACIVMTLFVFALGSLSSLGFSSLSFVSIFGMDILSFFD